MGPRHSFQQKIFFLTVILILIPVSLYSLFMIRTSIRSARQNYQDYAALTMKKVGETMDQALNELDQASYFVIGSTDIITFLSVPKEELLAFSRTEQPSRVYNILRYVGNDSDFIASIQIIGLNSVSISNGPLPMHITSQDMDRALALHGRAFWDVDSQAGTRDYLYLCRLLRDPWHPTRQLGYVKVYLDTQILSRFFQGEGLEDTVFFLLDETGTVRYSSASPEEETLLPARSFQELADRHGSALPFRHNGREYYAAPYLLSSNGWLLCGVSLPRSVNQQIAASTALLTTLTFFCLFLCVFLAYSLSRRATGPLREVVEKMKSMEDENFSVRIRVQGQDEIAQVASQFNSMAAKISSLVDEVYKADIRKKEAELRALQAQINPHFLYNTLDMAYWLAKNEHAPQTGEVISSLSHFFRCALMPAGEFTTVADEVEHLRYYLVLRQQGEPFFAFDLEMDPRTEGCRTVKLVLQPLVENAILHGIGQREDGWIRVDIFREEDRLVYRIADNGGGVDVAELEQLMAQPLESTRGFGIRNINDRIRLAFGQEYGLRFSNRPEGGTVVTAVFPFIPPPEEPAKADGTPLDEASRPADLSPGEGPGSLTETHDPGMERTPDKAAASCGTEPGTVLPMSGLTTEGIASGNGGEAASDMLSCDSPQAGAAEDGTHREVRQGGTE